MSNVPKRNVERRKAAENSEKKWKEAFEVDEEYDPLPEVLLRSLEMNDHSPTKNTVSDKLFNETAARSNDKLEEKDHYSGDICNCPSQIVLNDNLLKEIILSFACPMCQAHESTLTYSKSKLKRLESIHITCSKCQHNIFSKTISEPDLTNKKCSCDMENQFDQTIISKENSDNIELLVCDVDVMKQSEIENQYSKLAVENGFQRSHNAKTNIISRVKKKQHIKPIRPCFFCSKMQARLSRHIKTAHISHPYVQNMFKQPLEIQAKMMRKLRSEGIFAENQRRIKAGRFDLLRIRNQGTGELSACNFCRGYYKKKLMSRHKATCIARPIPKENCLTSLLVASAEKSFETQLNSTLENVSEHSLEGNSEVNFNWAEVIQNEDYCEADSSDPPEISRIQDILDGLGHGIFSHSNHPLNVNGFFIKQEKEDFIEENSIANNGNISANAGHHFREGESNEDQMLFDSLPAILSNSNTPMDINQGCQIPVHPKKRRLENYHEGYGDENNYYLWQDITENDLQDQDLLPCDSLCVSQRKRKPRSEFQYQFWKKEDENQILCYFTDMIKALKVPGKDACHEFLKKNPHIKTDWTRVKYKVYNQIQKHKKKSKKD